MDQNGQDKQNTNPFAGAMKSATEFWEPIFKMWSSPLTNAAQFGAAGEGAKGSSPQEQWQNAMFKSWQTLLSTFPTFDVMGSAPEGSIPANDTFRILRSGWEGYFKLYNQWLKGVGKSAQPGMSDDLKSSYPEFIQTWMEIYEREIQPVLNAPQIGLTRFYQERMNQFVDKFTIYQTALTEFIHLLCVPVEKSLRSMEEKIEALSKEGKLSGNFQDYYNMWIKALEGQYMTLFKSPEYLQAMSRALGAVQEFNASRSELLSDLLQFLPIPTNKDMDELYKELYSLKKKVKELSARLEATPLLS